MPSTDARRPSPIAGDALYALSSAYEVDGRVSWHPPHVRGVAPMNCYLLLEDGDGLLVDTGLTVHERAMRHQLAQLVAPGASLDVITLRQGEFDSLCNIIPILTDYGVRTLYGQFDDVIGWAAFRPEHDAQAARLRQRLPTTTVGRGDAISLGDGGRTIEVVKPMMRLLTTIWLFDVRTGTLCTSDMFTHALPRGADAPWVIDARSDTTTYEDVREHLLGTRYWWIPHARVDEIRRDLAGIFERYDVTCIAPAWGCILQGRDVVARHYQMVDQVLQREGRGDAAR